MLILEIAVGVFLGGMCLWVLGLFRAKKQTRDIEGQANALQHQSDKKIHEALEAVEDPERHSGAGEADPMRMALRYYNGDQVPQDYKEAMKWCRVAATKGNIFAQNMLGHMYLEGEGVLPDFQEALKWHQLTADRGDCFGQNMLGLAHAKGQGVEQDYREALRWYRLSAAQRHAAAMFNLGTMYRNGEGIEQDPIRARMWYSLAAADGSGEAKYFLLVMNDEMTPDQIQEAEKMANACVKNGYRDSNQERAV